MKHGIGHLRVKDEIYVGNTLIYYLGSFLNNVV